MMMPRARRPAHLDVTAAMHDAPVNRIPLEMMTGALFEEEAP
jgi:hypothetical protein